MGKRPRKLTELARQQDVSVLTVIKRAIETTGDVAKAADLLECTRAAIYYHLKQSNAVLKHTVERETA